MRLCKFTAMRFTAWTGTAAVAMMLLVTGIARADCTANVGQHVILASDGMNPDVFVWDTHTRLTSYLVGHWTTTKEVMAHAMLVAPGTIAKIVTCRAHDARTRYDADPLDVLGVRLLAGPHRLRYGWVVSSDAHAQKAESAR